jgi:salicylate hydroxylase
VYEAGKTGESKMGIGNAIVIGGGIGGLAAAAALSRRGMAVTLLE